MKLLGLEKRMRLKRLLLLIIFLQKDMIVCTCMYIHKWTQQDYKS